MGIFALPLLAGVALIDAIAAATLALVVPYISARLAAALRHPIDRLALGELFLAVGLVSLIPVTVLALVVLLPLALHLAADKDSKLRSTHWNSLNSSARGDTQSWSGG